MFATYQNIKENTLKNMILNINYFIMGKKNICVRLGAHDGLSNPLRLFVPGLNVEQYDYF